MYFFVAFSLFHMFHVTDILRKKK